MKGVEVNQTFFGSIYQSFSYFQVKMQGLVEEVGTYFFTETNVAELNTARGKKVIA